MTDLSPAAQAVLKAACIHHGLFNEEVVQRRRSIAAALRAAADQSENLYDPHEGKVSVVRVGHLIAIADELEAQ